MLEIVGNDDIGYAIHEHGVVLSMIFRTREAAEAQVRLLALFPLTREEVLAAIKEAK